MEVVSLERVVVALALVATVQFTSAAHAAVTAPELATARGTVLIREAPAGQRSVACSDLVVEARGGLDNDLIGETHPASDSAGVCRYALSVPAQSAVWLRLRPQLVDAVSTNRFSAPVAAAARPERASRGAIQLRFRVIAPTTFFFAPGERKDVPLTY